MARRGDPAESEFTARVMQACNLLKQHGLADVAKLLAKTELQTRKPQRASKRKAYLVDSAGKRRGSFYIDPAQIEGEVVKDEV